MQSMGEKKSYDHVIKKTCYMTDFIYIMLHLLYLVLFLIDKKYPLVFVNIGSIVTYLLFLILLKYEKHYYYALGCGFEFLVSMSLSTVLCGFESGFYLAIIGLSVVSFFTVYFSKKTRRIKKAVGWCIYSLVIYLALHFYSSFNSPIIPLDKWLNVTLYAINSVVVFAFVISYLVIFLNYAIKLENKIINESRIDRLTQIHNRYDLYNYIESIDNLNEYALAIFDIDNFKKVNDIHGHVCGDYILKEVARLISESLASSFVSRYGGEEFVVISKVNNDMTSIFNMLDNTRKIIEENVFDFNGEILHITVTIGLAKYEGEISTEKWIGIADEKMYSGKNSGKNKTVM